MGNVSSSGKLLWKAILLAAMSCVGYSQEAIDPKSVVTVEEQELREHAISADNPIHAETKARVGLYKQVELDILVDKSGAVIAAKPVRGPKEYFAQAVEEAKTWKYKPFVREGNAVYARVQGWVNILPAEDLPLVHIPFPQLRDLNSLVIALSRSTCFGTCPGYKVEIRGNGTVAFNGTAFVNFPGTHTDHISQDDVDGLVRKFASADFFSLKDAYTAMVTDNPSYVIEITIDGRHKSVHDYVGPMVGMPDAVGELENEVDHVADTERWIVGNKNTLRSLQQEHWDFKSKEAGESLLDAIRAKKLEVATMLIEAGVPAQFTKVEKWESMDGRKKWPKIDSVVSAAASVGDEEFLRFVLDRGGASESPEAVNEALISAARLGKISVFDLLIKAGADPAYRNKGWDSVLTAAATGGSVEIVKEIIAAHPDVNLPDSFGHTALMNVCGDADRDPASRVEVAKMLIQAGADPNLQDSEGNAVLHKIRNADCARVVIAGGADVNLRNKMGSTPLIENYSEEVIEMLLEAGANPALKNDEGKTALDNARYFQNEKAVKLIEQALSGKIGQ